MFRIEFKPLIWLSMNCWRVCAFAFGKDFSRSCSALRFASVSPPLMRTNE